MIYGIKTSNNYHEVEASSFCFGVNRYSIEYIEVLEEK